MNDASRDIMVPVNRDANHKWLTIPAGQLFEFKNLNEKDLYARYELVRFLDDKKSGPERYKVEAHIRKNWKEPENPGLTLIVENFEQSQGLNSQFSTEDWSIPMPWQLKLIFYNIRPSDHIAEYSKIQTQGEIVESIRDPYEPGGRRFIKRGGGVKSTRREAEELLIIKKAREGVQRQVSFAAEQLIREQEEKEKKKETVKKTKK